MLSAVLLLAAYLIGSISFAVIISRVFGLPDPHTYGSGNPGATNVLRTGSRQAAALTLAGDALKGACALWLAQRIGAAHGLGQATLAGVALAAFLGHLFPVYFRFKGGKGVATAAGIMLAMDWRFGLAVVAMWLAVALVTRYSSLAAVSAALVAPLVALMVFGPGYQTVAVLMMALLLLWRHTANIRKLLAGTETRIKLGG